MSCAALTYPRTDVPNAGAGLKTLPEKEKWNRAFETYLRELDAKKPVIWCGDMNVVAAPIGASHLIAPALPHVLNTHTRTAPTQISATGRRTTTNLQDAPTRR